MKKVLNCSKALLTALYLAFSISVVQADEQDVVLDKTNVVPEEVGVVFEGLETLNQEEPLPLLEENLVGVQEGFENESSVKEDFDKGKSEQKKSEGVIEDKTFVEKEAFGQNSSELEINSPEVELKNAGFETNEADFSNQSEQGDHASENLGPLVIDGTIVEEPQGVGPTVLEEAVDSPEVLENPNALPVIFETPAPWQPSLVPLLQDWNTQTIKSNLVDNKLEKSDAPSPITEVDVNPPQPSIAILIDDLGYNRSGMEASLALPAEVALAILPATPFAKKTAETSHEQKRITLLHAPMENQREMKLGPGGLYQAMTEQELKSTLVENLEGLPGVLGVNNHMGSLLTTDEDAMTWVMETLQGRSLFFIDSLTSSKSVAGKIAREHGLKTVTRDVFLDNIRTESAIDKQFERLLKHARRHGEGLAIGHPYSETMSYLKSRLQRLNADGVKLIPITDLLIVN